MFPYFSHALFSGHPCMLLRNAGDVFALTTHELLHLMVGTKIVPLRGHRHIVVVSSSLLQCAASTDKPS